MPPYVPPLDEVEADLVATHLRPVLTSMFAPATDAGDADEMYTTTELHLLIEDHAPGMIQVEHMRTALALKRA